MIEERCNHRNCPIQFDKIADTCDIKECPYRTTTNLRLVYAFMLHREFGISIDDGLLAHDMAIEYLRSKSRVKG